MIIIKVELKKGTKTLASATGAVRESVEFVLSSFMKRFDSDRGFTQEIINEVERDRLGVEYSLVITRKWENEQ